MALSFLSGKSIRKLTFFIMKGTQKYIDSMFIIYLPPHQINARSYDYTFINELYFYFLAFNNTI